MANGVDFINMTQLGNEISAQVVSSISPLITIFKAIGVAVLVYIIFLFLRALFRWKTVSKVGKIAKNVDEINEKLGILISQGNIKLPKQVKEKKEKKEKKGKIIFPK